MSILKQVEASKAAKAAREQGICPLCKKPVKPYIAYCGQCGCDLQKGVKLATSPASPRYALLLPATR